MVTSDVLVRDEASATKYCDGTGYGIEPRPTNLENKIRSSSSSAQVLGSAANANSNSSSGGGGVLTFECSKVVGCRIRRREGP